MDAGIPPDGAPADGVGSVCPAGDWDHDRDPVTPCVEWTDCEAGEFVATSGTPSADRTCEPCPEGTSTSGVNQVDCLDPDACPAGTEELDGTCNACGAGEFCAGGDAPHVACGELDDTWDDDADPSTPCIDRTRCSVGMVEASAGSATTDRVCAERQGCVGNPCDDEGDMTASCTETADSGFSCECFGGSSTRGRACERPECGDDENVEGGRCVPCATGTNAAGDNPTAGDTSCDDACSMVLGAGLVCDVFDDAYVKGSNTGAGDQFGYSVAIDGDTLAVSAPWEDGPADTQSATGAVYVFVRTDGVWSQQGYLRAATDANDYFGQSLAVSGDTIAVGARSSDGFDNRLQDSGAVYIFSRSGSRWSETALLTAPHADRHDEFGHSIALQGNVLVVGAPFEDSDAFGVGGDDTNNLRSDSGAAYVYREIDGTWTQEAFFKASNPSGGDQFGVRVAIDDDTIVVASFEGGSGTGVDPRIDDELARDSGAVYVFRRSAEGWTQEAHIKAPNTESRDHFGRGLAIDGDLLAVGAPFEAGDGSDMANNDLPRSGAVYLFERSGTSWTFRDYLKASNVDDEDFFGEHVALQDGLLLAAARFESSSSRGFNGVVNESSEYSGAVYLFRRASAAWTQVGYIKSSNTGPRDYFGTALAYDRGTLVVGANSEDSNATGIDGDQRNDDANAAGAAYVRRIAISR